VFSEPSHTVDGFSGRRAKAFIAFETETGDRFEAQDDFSL
jgi:hypothetical protein